MILFGDFALDPEARVLRRDGRLVPLTPKAFQLLDLLVRRHPRAVEKAELIAAVWPQIAVTEGSLANPVLEIRTATGDDARRPRLVRTVHRFGYAFCAEARVEEPSAGRAPARFCLMAADGERALHDGDILIGRAEDCQVRLRSTTVSRHHARIHVEGDRAWVEDLGSKNGTLVGGTRIEGRTALGSDEQIQVGAVPLRFFVPSASFSTDSYAVSPRGQA
jgi:DNA-binding winged helix-turn-helix (wHTH) protein